VDDGGIVYITGRIKEQFELENGKLVFPSATAEESRGRQRRARPTRRAGHSLAGAGRDHARRPWSHVAARPSAEESFPPGATVGASDGGTLDGVVPRSVQALFCVSATTTLPETLSIPSAPPETMLGPVMRCALGRMGAGATLVVALGAVAVLTSCDANPANKGKTATGSADQSASGPQPLRAPKVRTGTVDLAGHCDENYAVDVEDGGIIAECTVTSDFQVGDVTCAKDSRPQTYDDRSLRSCAVKGVLAAGGLECRDAVYFYPDGTLQTCQLVKPVRHLGKPCKTRVEFNTDGGFRECE